MKKTILLTVKIMSCLLAQAQSLRIPIHDVPSSAYSLSLGESCVGSNQQEAYIYNNPSAAFLTEKEKETTVDFSLGIVDDKVEKMYIHTLTASHRHGARLLLAGFRYYMQGAINHIWDENMNLLPHCQRFYSYAADLGYAHLMGRYSVYGSVGIVSEKTMRQTNAFHLNIGANYNASLNKIDYMLGVGIKNWGFGVYENKQKALTPLVHAGGAMSLPMWHAHTLSFFIDTGGYVDSEKSKLSLKIGLGIDYTFLRRFSLRMGSHMGDKDNYLSAGLGVKISRITINVATKLKHKEGQNDIYMVGMKVFL